MIRSSWLLGAALILGVSAAAFPPRPSFGPPQLQVVVTSDAHYGITRPAFRGHRNVDAHVVNAAMVASLNALSALHFPRDGGAAAGQLVGPVDAVLEAGDITNRQEQSGEDSIQPAAASWTQFVADYVSGLHLRDGSGAPTPLWIVPGNHEASNAVGFYTPMHPATDPTPLLDIYNRMVAPQPALTTTTFDYQRDRVFFTRDLGGIHFVFLQIWPDSVMRLRMERDLETVRATTPVVIVTHDQPDVQSKHFVNPNGAHDVNPTDRFENLLADRFADGSVDAASRLEQEEFEAFLRRHPNVTAYFHGNSNWHQVYDWNGPNRSARLHTVRADSPMKGAVSGIDETKLSFAVVTFDLQLRTMTVRECLWNANPLHPEAPAAWGETVTTTLEPRPTTGATR